MSIQPTTLFASNLSTDEPFHNYFVIAIDSNNSQIASELTVLNAGASSGGIPVRPSRDPLPSADSDDAFLTGASINVYLATTAELFWNRPDSSLGIIEVEVFRNGELLGTTTGTSFFDDTRTEGTDYTYELIASVDTVFLGSTVVGSSAGELVLAGTDLIISEVLSVINTEALQEAILLTSLSFPAVENGFTIIEPESPSLLTFACPTSGTVSLTREPTPTRQYSSCADGNTLFNGTFRRAGASGAFIVELDEFSVISDELLISIGEGSLGYRESLDGERRWLWTDTVFSNSAVNASIEATINNVTLTRSADNEFSAEVSAVVTVDDTSVTVSTSNTTLQSSNEDVFYTSGQIQINDYDGLSIVIDADGGDANSALITVTSDGSTESEIRTWSADFFVDCLSEPYLNDPFLDLLVATKQAGLRTMVYINSSNMLERVGEINPSEIPDITERWKSFCDSDLAAQAFINSEPYHQDAAFPERKYMFCYAEFVLKDYAIRYGDLVDSWLFDSGDFIVHNGDNATRGIEQEQHIYRAFTDAVRAGNPKTAVSFNNGPERETEALNPFSEAVRYDDFMFGHPYNGGRVIGNHENGLYQRNYAQIQKITETGGNVHSGGQWLWDDKVVGHFDPPMSTTSWKGGSTPALTDGEFLLWNLEATRGGGAISWGTPLIKSNGYQDQLKIQDWGMAQLTLMDEHLSIHQSPGEPNWSRAETPLPNAAFGQPFIHTLVDGINFWDPESDDVILSLIDAGYGIPEWLTIAEDASTPGSWILSGTPTESVERNYQFTLRAEDASGYNDRDVNLLVTDAPDIYPYESNVDILAAENTAYGENTIATIVSDIITAPDGMATFQIALDVTPQAGGEIVTGDVNTNTTTSSSWGIGEGQFRGEDDDRVESIGNIRVINFNANGSALMASDVTQFSFEYAYVSDGQSAGDRIEVEANGVVNVNGGLSLTSNPDTLNLKVQGYIPITELVLGVGTDASNNKWSVNSINVSYTIN